MGSVFDVLAAVGHEAVGARVVSRRREVVVTVHVANCFGYMVVVVADGQLRRMAPAGLVESLEVPGSL